jgi:hypothetical protein
LSRVKLLKFYGLIGYFGKDFAYIKRKHQKNAIDMKKSMAVIDKRCFSAPEGAEKHLIKYYWIGL